MSRYLYMTAGTLLLFSVIAFGMTFAHSSYQPDLPASGTMWKTTSMFLLLGAVGAAFVGVLAAMYEQVVRRDRERKGHGTVLEFPSGGRAGRAAGQEKYSPRDSSSRNRGNK